MFVSADSLYAPSSKTTLPPSSQTAPNERRWGRRPFTRLVLSQTADFGDLADAPFSTELACSGFGMFHSTIWGATTGSTALKKELRSVSAGRRDLGTHLGLGRAWPRIGHGVKRVELPEMSMRLLSISSELFGVSLCVGGTLQAFLSSSIRSSRQVVAASGIKMRPACPLFPWPSLLISTQLSRFVNFLVSCHLRYPILAFPLHSLISISLFVSFPPLRSLVVLLLARFNPNHHYLGKQYINNNIAYTLGTFFQNVSRSTPLKYTAIFVWHYKRPYIQQSPMHIQSTMPKGHRPSRSQGYYRVSPVLTSSSNLPQQYQSNRNTHSHSQSHSQMNNSYYPSPLDTMSQTQQQYNTQASSSYATGGPVQHPSLQPLYAQSQSHSQQQQPHVNLTTPPPVSIRASSGAWTPQDDSQLMTARSSGMNWLPIQQAYFPTKSANACRKRHERLMERRNADDWDGVKLEVMAKTYMGMRRELWQPLADLTGEKWTVVESKVCLPPSSASA